MRDLYRINISKEDADELFKRYIHIRSAESILPSFSIDRETMIKSNLEYLENLLEITKKNYNNYLAVCVYKNSNIQDISKYKCEVDFDEGYITLI